ncbi:dnaJ homolog subfamily C member 30, mitochondrial-like [Cololabis saira]|uniref:dnaJ homolog subfamily C member 30, mitochondrial-like n=1 Tax=Cololabis saira TaxID=129043 RepID=UPI002AD22842|nr:dnaJ homolog subfamily C member 30, mitochondrial-like [Cololabis saira]
MAEVRQCLGRGAQDVAVKVYSGCLLESHNKHGISVVHHASCLSAGALQDDTKHCDRSRAGKSAGGVCQDGYTRLQRVDPDSEHGKVVQNDHSRGLGKQSLISQRRLQLLHSSAARYRNSARFSRTPSSSSRCAAQLDRAVFIRWYSGHGTRAEPLYKTKTGYYDVLEVSPSATHAQIKTAYYKQSFVFHPDKNAGSDDATTRFSEISEAYTVLGNKALRRKYDRGLLSLSDLTATVRPSGRDPAGGSGRQQAESKRSVVGTDLREGVFDFDQFFKSHYSEQLQRDKDMRLRREENLKKQKENVGDQEMGRMSEIGVGVLMLFGIGIYISIKRN